MLIIHGDFHFQKKSELSAARVKKHKCPILEKQLLLISIHLKPLKPAIQLPNINGTFLHFPGWAFSWGASTFIYLEFHRSFWRWKFATETSVKGLDPSRGRCRRSERFGNQPVGLERLCARQRCKGGIPRFRCRCWVKICSPNLRQLFFFAV